MNLLSMRADVRTDIFDLEAVVFTDAQINSFLNRAMMHVANWADFQKQALFQMNASAVLRLGTNTAKWYAESPDGFGLDRTLFAFRRFIQLQWLNGPKWVNIREVDQMDLDGFNDGDEVVVSVIAEGLRYVNGGNKSVLLTYVHSLPFMVADTDTPGSRSNFGPRDRIPPEYHPMIVAWAVLQALASMNLDVIAQVQIYKALQLELQATLVDRRSEKVGGGR